MEKPNTWLLFGGWCYGHRSLLHRCLNLIRQQNPSCPWQLQNYQINKKCLAMPISCLSRGFAACQSCLSGKVIYSHRVEDSGQSIPFSHGDLSIIGYEKCINGRLKYLMTNKSTRMASPLHGKLGVPDLSIDHGYAPRSGWPQTVVQASFLPFPFSIHFYLSKKSLGKFVKNGP